MNSAIDAGHLLSLPVWDFGRDGASTVTSSRECPICPGTGKIICYSLSPLLFLTFRSSLSSPIDFCIQLWPVGPRESLPKRWLNTNATLLTCTTRLGIHPGSRENPGRWSIGRAARLSSPNEEKWEPRGICGERNY